MYLSIHALHRYTHILAAETQSLTSVLAFFGGQRIHVPLNFSKPNSVLPFPGLLLFCSCTVPIAVPWSACGELSCVAQVEGRPRIRIFMYSVWYGRGRRGKACSTCHVTARYLCIFFIFLGNLTSLPDKRSGREFGGKLSLHNITCGADIWHVHLPNSTLRSPTRFMQQFSISNLTLSRWKKGELRCWFLRDDLRTPEVYNVHCMSLRASSLNKTTHHWEMNANRTLCVAPWKCPKFSPSCKPPTFQVNDSKYVWVDFKLCATL